MKAPDLTSNSITSARAGRPKRRCIATGQVLETTALVRFVVGPGDEIVPDVAGKLPGRGLWLTASAQAIDLALAKTLFPRAAGRRVRVPSELAAVTERLLAGRALEYLGRARRAGELVLGFERIRSLAGSG